MLRANREVSSSIFKVFGMTWKGISPTTSHTPGKRSTTRPPGAVLLQEFEVGVVTGATAPGGLVVERTPGVWEVVGSIPGRVITKTLKMVLDVSLLSTRHIKDR